MSLLAIYLSVKINVLTVEKIFLDSPLPTQQKIYFQDLQKPQ